MSDEILEKFIEYYGTGRTEKSKELIIKVLTKNKNKLENISQGLKEPEIWKNLVDYSRYQVSSYGRFKNSKEQIMKPYICSRKFYVCIGIGNKIHFAHRLVASTFLETDEKRPFVHHINAIPFDNRVANLKYVTAQENSQATFEIGGGNAKRLSPVNEVDKDNNIIASYKSITEASNKTKLKISTIQAVCSGRQENIRGRIFKYADKRKIRNKTDEQIVALYNIKTNIMIKGPFLSLNDASKIAKIPIIEIQKYITSRNILENNLQWRTYDIKIKKENWLTFRNTKYEVSNFGRIRNKETEIILKPQLITGRYFISLTINNKRSTYNIARLVHETHNSKKFIPNHDVDHINGNCHDNRAVNLQSLSKRENILKSNEKSIYQIDIDGNIIEEFKSLTDAAKVFNTSTSDLSKSAKRKGRICKNFFWRYSNAYDNEEKERIKNLTRIGSRRIVEQYDISGNIIKRWLGITEAAKFCNINLSSFIYAIKRDKIIADFIWKYAGTIPKSNIPVKVLKSDGTLVGEYKNCAEAEKSLKINRIAEIVNGEKKNNTNYVFERMQ